MPKIRGAKEKRHQPYWDTLIRGDVAGGFQPRTAAALANQPVRLFQAAGQGNVAISNMEAAGSFPSNRAALAA